MVVWTALVGTMTLATGCLMMLEPGVVRPQAGYALAAVDSTGHGVDAVFNTPAPVESTRWDSIIVHHSGQLTGNARSIHELHEMGLGYGGLGYHFVIGNGKGSDNGTIEVGYRWDRQVEGVYARRAISICLVGNGDRVPPTPAQMQQLVLLVRTLQVELGIDADAVHLHSAVAETTSPGRLFPVGSFRSQLID